MKLHLLTVWMLTALTGSCCLACSQKARDPQSAGSRVRVSGRIELNPRPPTGRISSNSRVVVKLRDVSLADGRAKILASVTLDSVSEAYITDGAIPFTIEAVIPTETPCVGNSVTVSATLTSDGTSYITDTAYYVDLTPGTFDYKDMLVTLVKYPS